MPDLRGTFFYGDTVDAFIKSFRWNGSVKSGEKSYPQFDGTVIYAFGEDAEGELLVLDGPAGTVSRIVPQ
jgi:hypothetical protein